LDFDGLEIWIPNEADSSSDLIYRENSEIEPKEASMVKRKGVDVYIR
jgi:hypothetical protein